MKRLLLILCVLATGVFSTALFPSEVTVENTAEPRVSTLAPATPYSTLLSVTQSPLVTQSESITQTDDINARFAGLLAHIRWLFDQENTSSVENHNRRIDRGDTLVWRQFDTLMDNTSENFTDLGEAFDTSILTVDTTATIEGDLTVIGSTTLASLMADSLRLPSLTPANTTNLLYNTAGDLYWQGNLIAGGAVGNWVSNGADVYRLTGNVGIGTNNPVTRFQVTDPNSSFIFAESTASNSTAGFALRNDIRQWNIGVGAGGAINFSDITTGLERMRIDSFGNVGIGTTTPATRLAVEGGGLFTDTLLIAQGSLGAGGLSFFEDQDTGIESELSGELQFTANGTLAMFMNEFEVGFFDVSTYIDPNGVSSVSFSSVGTSTATTPQFNLGGSGMFSPDTGWLAFATNGLERLTVDGSGNIGIGTTTPGMLLDVQGAAQFGTNNVNLITTTGQLAGLSSTFVAAGSSDDLASIITDETGAGSLVFSASPTFTGVVNTAALTVSNNLTLAGAGANLVLGSNYLSGDGDDEGISIDGNGRVGIGGLIGGPDYQLDIASADTTPGIGYALRLRSNSTAGAAALQFSNFSGGAQSAFIAATDAGNMLISAAGSLRFGSSNTERLQITAGGDVGIGTSNPLRSLHITSPNGWAETLLESPLSSTSTLGRIWTMSNSGDGRFSFRSANSDLTSIASPLALFTNGSAAIGSSFVNTVLGSMPADGLVVQGNVGIGTTSPQSLLHVFSPGSGRIIQENTGQAMILQRTTGGNGFQVSGQLYRVGSNEIATILAFQDGVTDATAGGFLTFGTKSDGGSLQERLRITSTGNIGIGTSDPTQRLSVAGGTFRLSNTDFVAGSAGTFLDTNLGAASGNTFAQMQVFTNGGLNPGALSLQPISGNVGIGTTNPDAKLDVIGNIYVRPGGATGAVAELTADPASGVNGISLIAGFASGGFGPIRFITSGSERMMVAANGNVGIGTTNADAKLRVVSGDYNSARFSSNITANPSSLDAGEIFSLDALSGINGLTFGPGDGRFISFGNTIDNRAYMRARALSLVSTSDIVFNSGNLASEAMRILANGNVGISTTNPSYRLHIDKAGNGNGINLVNFDAAVIGAVGPVFNGANPYNEGNQIFLIQSWTGDPALSIQRHNVYGYLQTISNAGTFELRRGYAGQDGVGLSMTSGGNVGIGTTDATARLQVRSGGFVNSPVLGNITNYAAFFSNLDPGYGLGIGVNSIDGRVWLQSQRTDSAVAHSLTLNEAGGNVGIGTSNPESTLDVNGNAHIRLTAFFGTTGHGNISANTDTLYVRGDNFAVQNASATVNRLYINSSGNVGIGTISPLSSLHVIGGVRARQGIPDAVDSSNRGFSFGSDGDTGMFSPGTESAANGLIAFSSNGVETMRIASGGFVGIGTSNPTRLLQLRLDGNPEVAVSATNAGSNSAGIFIENEGQRNWQVWADRATDTFRIGNNSRANTNLTIDSAGNVGIGTSSPTQKLHINDSAGSSIVRISGFNPELNLDTGTEFSGFQVRRSNEFGPTGWITKSVENVPLLFGTNNLFRMIVGSDGNIGIATTTPSAVLTVSGTVRFATITGGTLQTDALGNVTASSDERLKDINGDYTAGLEEILGLEPIQYNWTLDSGFDTETLYAGFSAQNVQEFLPAAVGQNPDGFLTLSDRPIIAALVNAVKEVWERLTGVESRVDELEQRVLELEAALNQSQGGQSSSGSSEPEPESTPTDPTPSEPAPEVAPIN